MTAAERIKNIGIALGFINETKLEDVKDVDGNIIRIDGDFAVGTKAQLISSDGTIIDLTDGDYILEDGRAFTVATGAISAISQDVATPVEPTEDVQPIAQAVVEPVVAAAPAVEPVPEPEAEIPEEPEAIEARFAAIEATLETILEYIEELTNQTGQFKEVKKKLEKQKEEMASRIAELEKIPAGDPIQIKAAKVNKDKIENKPVTVEAYPGYKMPNLDFTQMAKDFKELHKK